MSGDLELLVEGKRGKEDLLNCRTRMIMVLCFPINMIFKRETWLTNTPP